MQWIIGEDVVLDVAGPGLIDAHLYQQESNRLILHLVNLTSAATWRQPLEEYIPIGPIEVKVRLPKKIRGKNVELKVSNQRINGKVEGGWTAITITSLVDHEMVVIV